MKVLASAVAVASAFASGSAMAREIPGREIKSLVEGTTVELDTPLGKTIPIRHLANGLLSGQAGELASYLGAESDGGRWWVDGNRLCQKWRRWFSGETQCLALDASGDRIRWRNQDGTSGTARIIARERASAAVAPTPPARLRSGLGGPVPAAPKAGVAEKPAVAKAAKPATGRPAAVTMARPPLHKVANVNDNDVLNVRSGPSSEAAIVATLGARTSGVSVSGPCRSSWCPITHGEVRGWVHGSFLVPEAAESRHGTSPGIEAQGVADAPDAPRSCLSEPARALLETIELRFGRVRVISTCRRGATIAGTGRPSRHANGNAIDFDAGSRKGEIVAWLAVNHKAGGTMTYRDMDHVHVDIGRHFVALADRSWPVASSGGRGRRWAGRPAPSLAGVR